MRGTSDQHPVMILAEEKNTGMGRERFSGEFGKEAQSLVIAGHSAPCTPCASMLGKLTFYH